MLNAKAFDEFLSQPVPEGDWIIPVVPIRPTVRVLFLSIYYPFFLGKYFERAMRRNPNIELKTCGPFTGSWIPWMGGMSVSEKYANPPDIPLPFPPNVGRVSYDFVRAQLGDWVPDLVLTSDAGINWTEKPNQGLVATIGTDPHVLDYSHARSVSDKFFCMQKCYMEPQDVYLPYAYDPETHYPVRVEGLEDGTWKDKDAVLIGMPYPKRIEWVNELKSKGVSVLFENSPIFDEYRVLANRARIGLNWSDQNDLNARFFETPAFGLAMVANRVPDAHLFLEEDVDYLGFNSMPEAIEQVMLLKNNPNTADAMARSAYQKIQPHTYGARIEQILEECGF